MRLLDTAPGKLNLCLFVGAPRADGYHPLVSVFQSVALADELLLEDARGEQDEVVCPGVTGPNLAARAIALFRERSGWDGPAVRLTIVKRVPVAAGMGGGSGDAAAALRLAARAAGRADDDPLLAELAPLLGADVPFQLRPGRALVTGIGEHVEPVAGWVGHIPAAFVLFPSRHALSTPAVYAEADRLGTTREELSEAEAQVRAGHLPLVNDLQDAARSLCPEIDDRLLSLGDGALVAGSGPTVFKGYDDPERAAAVAAGLPGAILTTPC